MKYIFCALLILSCIAAYSCSCLPLGKINDEQHSKYDLIAKGKITKIDTENYKLVLTVKVNTYYKGKQRNKKIKIQTGANEAICGLTVSVGEKWLFFSYKKEDVYTSSLCTRTKRLSPKAVGFRGDEVEDDLKYLEEKRRH